jgi:hypothetical protein
MGTSGMICPCSVYGGLYPTHVSIEAVLISALSHTYLPDRSKRLDAVRCPRTGRGLPDVGHTCCFRRSMQGRAGRTVTCFLTVPHPCSSPYIDCNPTRGLRRRDGEMWVTECVPRTGARLSGPGRKTRRLELCWLCQQALSLTK